MQSLGRSDAAVEWIEVAVRHLASLSIKHGPAYALAVAGEAGIRVTAFDADKLRANTAQFQILSVYYEFDRFLRGFRREHPRQVRERRGLESQFSYVIDAFNVPRAAFEELEYDALVYYTEVRHAIVHPDRRTAPPVPSKHLTVEIAASSYAGLSAPKLFEAIGFDDFVLFSRAVKALARTLCVAASPTDEEIVDCLALDLAIGLMSGALKQNRPRLKNKLAAKINSLYGLQNRAGALADLLIDRRAH